MNIINKQLANLLYVVKTKHLVGLQGFRNLTSTKQKFAFEYWARKSNLGIPISTVRKLEHLLSTLLGRVVSVLFNLTLQSPSRTFNSFQQSPNCMPASSPFETKFFKALLLV
jgi:hypothetical protein